MTPEISTRLAALSPRPENASIAGSRSPENSLGASPSCPILPCPSRLDPAAPGDGPPSFLDSNPSDPMTPDPTPYRRPPLPRQRLYTRPSMTIHDDATRISRIKR